MGEGQIKEQIHWFTFSLAAQRNNLAQIFLRLRSIGAKAGTSLAFHHKFLRLMEQVAADQKKELGLICDIEEMENRHAQMRQQRRLRQANDNKPVPESPKTLAPTIGEEKPKRSSLLKLLLAFALLAPKPIKHKNQ